MKVRFLLAGLLFIGLLPLATAQDVVIELGPTRPSPCVGEPFCLEATATSLQDKECMIWADQNRFEFTVEGSNRAMLGKTSFLVLGLRPVLRFAVPEMSSATFAVPFPLLTVAWRNRSGGTMGPLPAGGYEISWEYRPLGSEASSISGEGSFPLTVLPRDENRLRDSHAALLVRAKAAYEDDLPWMRSINEREVVEYLLNCSTDPVAVPYLAELLESKSRALQMLAVRGLLRVGTEDAAAALRRFASGSRATDWERSEIDKWLSAESLPPPWEPW